jgi:crotonobetainyl-CoA:carnitine CoA-transferase CaiB-like acyl-CoA transferase
MNLMKKKMALEGIRVLDLTHVLSGPYCTMLLADMGAEVIKIEKHGEYDRSAVPLIRGESYFYMVLNRNKKGITLNLKHEKGVEILKQLTAKSDVVVENFRPGVMENLGIGYEILKNINPNIIFASISGYGQNSRNSRLVAYDLTAQAQSGVMSITGDPKGPPMRCGFDVGDIIPGLYTAFSILAALIARMNTGVGQMIDVSMVDSLILSQPDQFTTTMATGKAPERAEKGGHLVAFPYDAFRTRDEWIVIGCWGDPMFAKLARLIKRPELIEDPRFITEEDRCTNRSQLRKIIEKWLRDFTADEAIVLLRDHGVGVAEILDYKQVLESDQTKDRDLIQPIVHPIAGEIEVPGFGPKFSETPGGVRTPAPTLGEHNEEVYSGLLGYSLEQIKEFEKEGII